MAVVGSAKLWWIMLQMVLLVQAKAVKIKREPYAVQEMSQESFSSGSDVGGYSPWSETYSSSDSGGGHFVRSRGSFGGFYSSPLGGLSGFAMQDSPSGSSFGSFGPHIISGGKSLSDPQQQASAKPPALLLASGQKLSDEKVEKLRKSYGYGTLGYHGYSYPLPRGPIDLGTHHALDLGTTLDGNSIKDGKLRLPVQTVYITKTLGVPIPEPYPIKHEVAVPAPYPVPVPSHHYSADSYPSSFSSEYSSGSGKSAGVSLSKLVRYHENLPKSTEKHYASASTNYVRYLPARPHSPPSYRTALAPTHYSPKQSVYEFK